MKKDEVIVTVEKDGVIYRIPFSYAAFVGFERRHKAGSIASMVNILAPDCHSFARVGAAMNLSRERVRQWYMKNLARHFPQRNGRARRRMCAVVRPRRKTFPDYMRRLWREARKRGIAVSQINTIHTDGHVSSLRSALSLGGVQTCVHWLQNKKVGHRARVVYARTNITRKVVVRFPLHCFVISGDDPSGIRENYFFVTREKLEAYLGGRLTTSLALPLTERQQTGVGMRGGGWREFSGESGWNSVRDLCAQTPDP